MFAESATFSYFWCCSPVDKSIDTCTWDVNDSAKGFRIWLCDLHVSNQCSLGNCFELTINVDKLLETNTLGVCGISLVKSDWDISQAPSLSITFLLDCTFLQYMAFLACYMYKSN
jgi:hypothetical protein